jgi:hypothetical protein
LAIGKDAKLEPGFALEKGVFLRLVLWMDKELVGKVVVK